MRLLNRIVENYQLTLDEVFGQQPKDQEENPETQSYKHKLKQFSFSNTDVLCNIYTFFLRPSIFVEKC